MKKLFLLFVVSLVNLISHAQWSSTAPTIVCNASQHQNNATMIADGTGGYIMAWMDHRGGSLPNDPTFSNIYIQRLNADGVPQWTANGLLVCGAPREQNYPLLALCKTSTNQPRIMVVWRDHREVSGNSTFTKIYAQSYDLSGNAQWATNGVQVADCNGFDDGIHDVIGSSDSQKVVFSYRRNSSLYVQAINPDNGNTLYGLDGTLITNSFSRLNGRDVKFGQAEGSTDINIVWSSAFTPGDNSSRNIYAQRINSNTGTKQWANSTKVCIAESTQDQVQIQGDIVVWRDGRFDTGSPNNNSEVFAQRLNANGTVAWAANGINVTNDPGSQFYPRIAPTGTNSVWVTWTDETINSKDSSYVSIQKINSDGTLAFGNQGIKLTSNYNFQAQGMVVSQDDGGALVLYESYSPSYSRYRAHKISSMGQKLWGPLGQPISGFTQASPTINPYNIEGVPLAGGGAVFAVDPQDIWAMRAKICDTPPAVPSIVSPYRRCNPGSYNINLVSSGCPAGFVRYFSAPDGLRLLTSTNPANSNPNQTTLSSRDTTQYVYAECVVNGCASTGALTPAHIQIAETVYTDAELSAIYPKVTGELPTLALSRTTITAQNRINAPANVTYEAAQSVTLNPGFQANQGAVFRAEVKTCVNLN